jgi:transposase
MAGRGIWMDAKEQVELRLIEDYRIGKLSRRELAQLLGVSERAVTRRTAKVRQLGFQGIKHGNTGRTPKNKSADALRGEMLALVTSRYFDFNLTHCYERLTQQHGLRVSYSTFHRWCKSANVGKRRRRRASSHRIRRERMASEGLMLQMDGSHHRWNGADEWCLIAMIDDATSEIPAAQFFDSETTWGCMSVLRRVIEIRGVPEIIYTDEAGWAGGSSKRPQFSQFVRACEELGIRVITTTSPEAKGRIERAWRTTQDRLVPELREHGIRSMTNANRYLDQVWLPRYWNQRNTVEARSTETRWRKLSPHINLDQVLCIKRWRTVRHDHTVALDGRLWRILDRDYGTLRKRDVAAHITASGEVTWYLGHIRLQTEEVVQPTRRWKHIAS